MTTTANSGILLVDKEAGCTSFRIVEELRRLTKIKKIGHAGTLDPFATGVMVLLIGSDYTKKADLFLAQDKQYEATVYLGATTDTYDRDGTIVETSTQKPSLTEVETAILSFQGNLLQTPPMFSAKKVKGQKLCDLARRGISIERAPVQVHVQMTLISYSYPELKLLINCSKGTYIRSLAFDLGKALGCGAHLTELKRTKSGHFSLADCIKQENLRNSSYDISPHLKVL